MSEAEQEGTAGELSEQPEGDKAPEGEGTPSGPPEASAAGAEAKSTATKPGKRAAEPAPPPPSAGQWAFLGVVALATAGLDLWTKAWAIKNLSGDPTRHWPLCVAPEGMPHYQYQRAPHGEKILIQNFLDLQYAENCGGAWGLMNGAREAIRKPFFMVVTVGAVLFILHMYRSLEPNQRSMRLALPLVLGGAIGNLVDRMRLGYVVDFIHAHLRDQFHWPTFNVADIAITVGIGLMVLEYILGPKKAPAKVKPAAT